MRRLDPVQFLPTISWTAFYVGPLYLLHTQTAEMISGRQVFGATFILLMLLIGDVLAAVNRAPDVPGTLRAALLTPLALLVIALPVAHVLMSGEMPILKIMAGHSIKEALPDREHFNKDIPRIASYLFQYVLTVFGPLLFGMLIMVRRPIAAGMTLIWCLVYALTSGAKWPTLILAFTAVLVFAAVRPGRWRVALPILAIACGVVFFVAAERLSATMTAWAANGAPKAAVDRLRQFGPISVGDIHRLAEAQGGPTRFGRTIDYLIYRVYLGPVEVASRWYAHFPSEYGKYLGFDGILWQTDGGRAPSNIIGSDVYRKRFPNRYLDSTSAYASIDADAQAHWGLYGIVVAGCLLLVVRVVMRTGSTTSLGRVSNAAQLAILTTVPFQGSIQAIVLSQGLLLLLLTQLGFWKFALAIQTENTSASPATQRG